MTSHEQLHRRYKPAHAEAETDTGGQGELEAWFDEKTDDNSQKDFDEAMAYREKYERENQQDKLATAAGEFGVSLETLKEQTKEPTPEEPRSDKPEEYPVEPKLEELQPEPTPEEPTPKEPTPSEPRSDKPEEYPVEPKLEELQPEPTPEESAPKEPALPGIPTDLFKG